MNLTKKAKIALASGGVGLAALAAAVGIWQPWNQPEVPEQSAPPVQNQQQEQQTQKEGLTLTVGGEKVPCVLYEGDGWSIYVPESWTVDANENGGGFMSSEDKKNAAQVWVTHSIPGIYAGDYVSAYPQHLSDTETWQTRTFYHSSGGESWEVTCQAPEKLWDSQQRLMTAMARTFSLGDEMVFSGFSPVASQPDWQVTDEGTVLWMDKEGYIVNDAAEEYICTQMINWSKEKKVNYTGRYRMDDLTWAGSYTCVPGKEYIDVFRTNVWYEVVPGKESEILLAGGMEIRDGWQHEGFGTQVVVYHDGSAVEKTEVMQTNDTSPGLPMYLSDLLWDDPEMVRELTAEQLKACADWFNDVENNGLLRFPYGNTDGVGDYLGVLFYDLGETGEAITAEEKEALQQVGITDEHCPVYKYSRAFVKSYLQEKLGLTERAVEEILADPEAAYMPGTYLAAYDAWYQCNGDTAYMPYTFRHGEFHPSFGGRVKLYYTAPYLTVMDTDGLFDEPMVVTLTCSGKETWRILSNTQEIYTR